MSSCRTFIALVVGLSATGAARRVDAQNNPHALAIAAPPIVEAPHPPPPAIARYAFEPGLIERGTLRAISGNKVEPVTAVNVDRHLAAGALFVNRIAAVKEPPPPALGPPPHATSPGAPGVWASSW